MPSTDNYSEMYSKLNIEGTGYLAFRDIPSVINKYNNGNKVLDFGSGAGRSTCFLKDLGFNVEGVDINKKMIDKAKSLHPSINFSLIEGESINKPDNTYDLVFSNFVFFEYSSLKKIVASFKEIKRILRPGGVFIFTIGSDFLYTHNWLTVKNNYPQNNILTSGSLAKIKLISVDLELYDYFWQDADYMESIITSGFNFIDRVQSLGKTSDPYDWLSENKFPPYSTYVVQK
jgi:ubiquinone/menaquinone biosynthesis C-methylase UbiE